MKKALLVDIGNSRLKWALCNRSLYGQCAADYDPAYPEQAFERAWARLHEPPALVCACNVAGPEVAAALCSWCAQRWGVSVEFAGTARRWGKLVNGYRDSARLGVDRWLAMIAAWKQASGSLCVVDCGTALTVDVVDGSGRHRGGLILPGQGAMHAALLQRLPHLPDPGYPATSAGLGSDTRDAVRYGMYYATVGALARIASDVQARYGAQTRFYACGGGAAQAARHLGRGCRQIPDLVLKGLADYFSLT